MNPEDNEGKGGSYVIDAAGVKSLVERTAEPADPADAAPPDPAATNTDEPAQAGFFSPAASGNPDAEASAADGETKE